MNGLKVKGNYFVPATAVQYVEEKKEVVPPVAPQFDLNDLVEDVLCYSIKRYGPYLYTIVQVHIKNGKVVEVLESNQTTKEAQLSKVEDYLSGANRTFPD